jgi:hypothetical protein
MPTIVSLASQRSGQDNQEYGPSVRYCPQATTLTSQSPPLLSIKSIEDLKPLLTFIKLQTYHKVQLVRNPSSSPH